MTASIKFSDADANRNGKLDAIEFRSALLALVNSFDLNKDYYISNGQGWGEDGVNEITEDFKRAVPFDPSKINNDTFFRGRRGYSFFYPERDDGSDSPLTRYAWGLIGGDITRSNEIVRFVTKDQIRNSGWKFIDVYK
jgi:hypothetical protein